MKPRSSMPHSQGLSNNPYPKSKNPIPLIDTKISQEFRKKIAKKIKQYSIPRIKSNKKQSCG